MSRIGCRIGPTRCIRPIPDDPEDVPIPGALRKGRQETERPLVRKLMNGPRSASTANAICRRALPPNAGRYRTAVRTVLGPALYTAFRSERNRTRRHRPMSDGWSRVRQTATRAAQPRQVAAVVGTLGVVALCSRLVAAEARVRLAWPIWAPQQPPRHLLGPSKAEEVR